MGGPRCAVSDVRFWVFFPPLTIFQFHSLQGDLILAMTYGYEVRGLDDRMVAVARKMSEHGTATMLPGALLVNELPFREFSLFG
jgi:hypothetical protein